MIDYEVRSERFSLKQLVPLIGKQVLPEQLSTYNLRPQELLEKQYITSIPSITKRSFTSTCNRCGNSQHAYMGKIDCKRCNQVHLYCKKCIQMGRVLECSPLFEWIGPDFTYDAQVNPCTWGGILTDVQQRAADRAIEAVEERKRLLIWGVCGSGKTEMLFPAITRALELRQRICLATPRSDVVRELYPRFIDAFPNISIQALFSGSKFIREGAQLTLSTTHQLIHYTQAFDTMIIDEVDAFPYHADDMLPFITTRAVKKSGTMIYLTATPRKEQQVEMKAGKLPHVFVPRRFHGHDLPIPTLRFSSGLQKHLQAGRLPPSFYRWLKERKDETHQILLFVPTIALAEKIAAQISVLLAKDNWIHDEERVTFVHAEDEYRKEKVMKFRENKFDVLVTTTILERGVTFPAIDVVVLDAGHDVFDEAALVQIAGRAGRSADDPTGEVLFFHDGKTRAMVQAKKAIIQMNKRD